MDLTQTSEEIEVPAQNQMDKIEALERSVLEFYADSNDILEDDNEDDDDDEKMILKNSKRLGSDL